MLTGHLATCKTCQGLKINYKKISSNLLTLEVTVPSRVAQKLEQESLEIYKKNAKAPGFAIGTIPEKYIKEHFADQIDNDIKKYIYKFMVQDFLLDKNHSPEGPSFHFPRLEKVYKNSSGSLIYEFSASQVCDWELFDWKKLAFSPPKRKLYKDLDRQAKAFLETSKSVDFNNASWVVEDGDWVSFKARMLSSGDSKVFFPNHENSFWLKLSQKYFVDPFQKLFLNKRVGDKFKVQNIKMDNCPSDNLSGKGSFAIVIDRIWKGGLFCIDLFKDVFSLGSDKDVHDKLVEIFSFRNDISQRRAIVEEAFRVLIPRMRMEVPRHIVLRNKEQVLKSVSKLPDFKVYKSSPSFEEHLEALSEKQIREESAVDIISKREGFVCEPMDILKYLNLLSSERLAEFVYFKPKVEFFGQSMRPIAQNSFSAEVVREKTLNFIIKTIAKGA